MAESTHLERAKADFLETYGREHQTTLGVLSAYPEDQLDLRPHPKLKSALELAWMFVLERGLGTAVYNDAFADGVPQGRPTHRRVRWPRSSRRFGGHTASSRSSYGRLPRRSSIARFTF